MAPAEENINKAIELSTKPEDKDYALFVAGSIYERQKKYDKAEEAFHKVLADDPKNAMALNYLGYMLADRGTRLDEALGYIRRAVALDPQNGAYLDSLGWAYYKMGNYDLAEENLRRASERINNDPTVHDHLGELYHEDRTPEAGRHATGSARWKNGTRPFRPKSMPTAWPKCRRNWTPPGSSWPSRTLEPHPRPNSNPHSLSEFQALLPGSAFLWLGKGIDSAGKPVDAHEIWVVPGSKCREASGSASPAPARQSRCKLKSRKAGLRA